jgi:hypothetical protein
MGLKLSAPAKVAVGLFQEREKEASMFKKLLSAIAITLAPLGAYAFETAQPVTATPITALPFTISKPGNYYLPTDLTFSGAGVAIAINANEVVLDLNGRSLIASGTATSPNVGIGVAVFNHEDVVIQNGDIDKFGGYGILFDATDKKREHNQKNDVKRVNFNGDEVGVLTISGSINEVEFCDFDGCAVGIYDVATLGGDRFQSDNFENMAPREALNVGVGVLSTAGKGTLTEDCLFADCVTAGIIDQGTPDRLRFNAFVSNGATHIGGLSLGLADN